MEKVTFVSEEGDDLSFFVLEETVLNETRYLLVSDQDPEAEEDSEGEATILKCVSSEGEEDVYEFVEDDKEWNALLSVFQELVEEVDILA